MVEAGWCVCVCVRVNDILKNTIEKCHSLIISDEHMQSKNNCRNNEVTMVKLGWEIVLLN